MAPHASCRRWLPLLVLAAPLQAPVLLAQGGTGVTGPLPPGGAVLSNGLVELVFTQASLSSTNVDVDVEITDLVAGHTYEHEGWRLWEVELATQPAPGPGVQFVSVLPSDCPGPVLASKQQDAAGQQLVLVWSGCAVPGSAANETVDVRLFVSLQADSRESTWRLEVVPFLTDHALYTARHVFSLVQDPTVEHHLLASLGYLVRDPAGVLETAEAQYFDTEIRPGSQGNALYDAAGNGLYLAFSDPTGVLTKNFRYGASPDRTAVRLEAQSYSADLTDPDRPLQSIPLRVGRFQGDWWDVAELYRKWLANTEIAAKGLVAVRPDVADFFRKFQHLIVFSPLDDYFTPCGGVKPEESFMTPSVAISPLAFISSSVPFRIREFHEHWGLEHVSHLQFGAVWPVGEYDGVGQYHLSPQWETAAAAMDKLDFHHSFYLFDAWYRTENPTNPTFTTEGWLNETVLQLDGSHQILTQDLGPPWGQLEFAMIDPGTPKWIARMAQVGQRLAQSGVDGVFVDNFFPDLSNASFSPNQGHPPGYGPGHTQGFNAAVAALRLSAREINPGFTVFSEVMFESYIRHTDLHGPVQTAADLMTGDDSTSVVPLWSMLYHHLAILSPVYAGYFTRVPTVPAEGADCLGFGDLPDSVFSIDPLERHEARLGANYVNAFGWVNGSSIWSPDFGVTNPKCFVFSFEIPDPLPGEEDCFAEYKAVCEYAAELSLLRGETLAGPFLSVGVRQRDLVFTDAIPAVQVPLTPVLSAVDDEETVPIVVHGVWQNPLNGEVGVALANFSDQAFGGTGFGFDPAAYGLDPSQTYLVDLVQPAATANLDHVAGDQPSRIRVPAIGAEDYLFLRIHPAPAPQPTPQAGPPGTPTKL